MIPLCLMMMMMIMLILSIQVKSIEGFTIPITTTTTSARATARTTTRALTPILIPTAPTTTVTAVLSTSRFITKLSSRIDADADDDVVDDVAEDNIDNGDDENNRDHVSSDSNPPTTPSSSSRSSSSTRRVIDWIQHESLEKIVSKEEAITICNELINDQDLLNDLETFFILNWDTVIQKGINYTHEKKNKGTLSQLLGVRTTERLLHSVENVDVFTNDSQLLSAFLESSAIQELFTQTLYDGIYEFFQTIDVFGNIISKLPVIGPIRNKLRDDVKQQLDRSLGPLVRNFLNSYTLVAIGRASTYIRSPTNRQQFGKVNVRIVESMIHRPIPDLLQPLLLSNSNSKSNSSSSSIVDKLCIEVFDYLRQLNTNNNDDSDEDNEAQLIINDSLTFIYDIIGTRSIASIGKENEGEGEGGTSLDLHRIFDSSPTLETTTNQFLQKLSAINNETEKKMKNE
eukprot:CAMPEP_0170932822 /NCGR_PEP_ID=MMETSP0735-20130129/17175_1 /TAXON_ID=186038 /ORGANISM="Fragilariopsis kerguelensis, Strain L26-C5" /LENGTH=456 /DNA_ID=CAMNT_0011335301 /DNA_START=121 /DNA_END=1491 /DNA_ORIENTATION=-